MAEYVIRNRDGQEFAVHSKTDLARKGGFDGQRSFEEAGFKIVQQLDAERGMYVEYDEPKAEERSERPAAHAEKKE